MRLSTVILFLIVAILGSGCVTAHYRYSIAVPGADAAAPAKVELLWKGGSRSFTVNSCASTALRITEVMQPPLCPVADIPRGIEVRVTRPGYKPWEAIYNRVDDDFRIHKWDSFYRSDVVQLEPTGSANDSRMIDGTTIYR
jgi:hypothetical protein